MKIIKTFWTKLARNQKIAFSLLISLLILGPISVIFTPKAAEIMELGMPATPPDTTPIPTPIPTTIPSPVPCTIGIIGFSVSDYCGASNFRYAKYTCTDNYTVTDGGSTSCKSISVWVEYATQTCKQHPNCASPTPTPTPIPSVKPSPSSSLRPTPIPSVKPSPSSSLRPTPIPSVKPSPSPCIPRCFYILGRRICTPCPR